MKVKYHLTVILIDNQCSYKQSHKVTLFPTSLYKYQYI